MKVFLDNSINTDEISLKQLAQNKPEQVEHLLDALELLMYENELLRKIASRYSHDLRSPVTNIDMLLQLYEKAGNSPDKDLYITKMVKSIKRLQEGFEQLSDERKGLLLKPESINDAFLDEVLSDVRNALPKNIALSTDFTEGKKVKCNAKTLSQVILLLVEPFAEKGGIYALEINSERAWNGLILNIVYPEFLDLNNKEENKISPTVYKNALLSNKVLGWNYYFATLFLRTMGASLTVNESFKTQTVIQVSFMQ